MTGIGLRAAVLRRSEAARYSSPSDDEVGGFQARSARSGLRERSNQTTTRRRTVSGMLCSLSISSAVRPPAISVIT
jgi:hypothetical protein